MGWFDFCPNVPVTPFIRPSLPLHPYSCTNCHASVPAGYAIHEDAPGGLSEPIPLIREALRNGREVRWWQDANRQRASLYALERSGDFPLDFDESDLRLELTPSAQGLGSLSHENHLIIHAAARGMEILLGQNPLFEVTDLPIGNVRFFFDQGHLRTNRGRIANWLVDPQGIQRQIASMIPVAYLQDTGTLLHLEEYRILSDPRQREFYFNRSRRVPLSTRELDRLNEYYARNLRSLPYLLEISQSLSARWEDPRLSIQRLYRDLQALARVKEAHPSPPSSSESPIESAELEWSLHPRRLALPGLLAEFGDREGENRLHLRARLENGSLQTLQADEAIVLQSLALPGFLRLGRSAARIQLNAAPFSASLFNLQAELQPFDLGQIDPSQRGVLHVSAGQVRDGASRRAEGRDIAPGITVQQQGDAWVYSLNLHLEMDVARPGGRPLRISSDALGFGRLVPGPRGLEPERGSHYFSFENLSATSEAGAGEASAILQWFRGARLSLSDLHPSEGESGFQLRFQANETALPHYNAVSGEAFLPLRPNNGEDPARVIQEAVFSLDDQDLPALARRLALASTRPVYRPDASFSDFRAALNLHLEGRGRASATTGRIEFATSQNSASPCSRNYELSAWADRAGFQTPQGALELSPLSLEARVEQELRRESDEFRIDTFKVCANEEGPRRRGLLQGVACISQEDWGQGPLELSLERSIEGPRALGLRGLNLRFGAERVYLPALGQASRAADGRPQAVGLDVDGRFRMDEARYDFASQNLQGLFCLVGDHESDVMLRDASMRRLPSPLLRDTQWCSLAPTHFDWGRSILYGNFLLRSFPDLHQAALFGAQLPTSYTGPYILQSSNLPVSLEGFILFGRGIFFEQALREGHEMRIEAPSQEGR